MYRNVKKRAENGFKTEGIIFSGLVSIFFCVSLMTSASTKYDVIIKISRYVVIQMYFVRKEGESWGEREADRIRFSNYEKKAMSKKIVTGFTQRSYSEHVHNIYSRYLIAYRKHRIATW